MVRYACTCYAISPYSDSLVGKLIVHRKDREEAIRTMRRCLDEFHIAQIKTTISPLRQVFHHSDFLNANIDTGFIERMFQK